MSQENLEIVRRLYAAMGLSVPGSMNWVGGPPESIKSFERFIDAGDDHVLVFSREGGRGKGSGAEVQTHLTAHLWTLKDGKAVRMHSYWERAEALEAVGLSEQDARAEAS